MESWISGYCRMTDGARCVLYDEEEGADCSFPECVFLSDCPIAREIKENFEAKNGG